MSTQYIRSLSIHRSSLFMGLLQYSLVVSLRRFSRYASSTSRLQVLQNATQISDPQRIRNVGIIAHIDAGRWRNTFGGRTLMKIVLQGKQRPWNACCIMLVSFDRWEMWTMGTPRWITWTKNGNEASLSHQRRSPFHGTNIESISSIHPVCFVCTG